MSKTRARPGLAVVAGFPVLLLVACSGGGPTSSAGTVAAGAPSPSSGSASSTAGTGGLALDVGGSGGGGGGSGQPRDGGSVPLSPEDVDRINMSACANWSAQGEVLPAVLQLVVDVSSSMEEPAPGSAFGETKWDVTRDALDKALETLPASAAVGALYYPNNEFEWDGFGEPPPGNMSELACLDTTKMVSLGPLGMLGSAQRLALRSSLQEARLSYGTPTHDAYKYALDRSLQTYSAPGTRFMLLITDGIPSIGLGCSAEAGATAPIVEEISRAFAAGIRTFVIGSPGSEGEGGDDQRPWLSEAAQKGGTATAGCAVNGPNFCHLDMTTAPDFSMALVNGLAAVAGSVVDRCTFALPEPPPGKTIDRSLTQVVITTSAGSSLLLPDEMGDCSSGWQFDPQGQVALCPDSCQQVKADPSAKVQLLFGCSTDDVVPVK